MLKGKVKWYSEIKGFGFIEVDDGGDIFFHKSDLQGVYEGFRENQEVEFETRVGEKGLFAVNVKTSE